VNEQQIDELMSRMTLEEKCAQLGGVWHTHLRDEHACLDMDKAAPLIADGVGQLGAVAGQSLTPADAVAAVNALQTHLRDHTRLGIPALVHEEALEGVLAPGATQFPQAIGMASSWDPALVQEVATVSGRQARALGARLILSPVLDIAREPRWGRTEETFGEDPELVSRLGVAFVRGMQSNGVECCAKHFLGHGSPLAGLNHNEVVIGPRRLRDVDAAPFRAAINEAGLKAAMNAYHEIDGLPVTSSPEYLIDLLRDELGMGEDGIVVADYYAVDDLEHFHRVAVDRADAARQALTAGLDVELPNYEYYRTVPQQVRDGLIDEAVIDRSVRRVLRQKVRLGLFENPFVDADAVGAALNTPADVALARRAAARTMVLLQNDGVLPLRPGTRVAVLGPSADNARRLFGDYSFAFKKAHLSHAEVAATHDDGSSTAHVLTPLAALAERYQVVSDAATADVAVVFVGGQSGAMRHETSGEFLDASDLRLPQEQLELIAATAATGTPTVVVLIGGRVHSLSEVVPHANALMVAWLPGDEGAHGIVDVLSGDVDAGGRLPIGILRTVGQVGIYAGHHHGGGRSVVYDDYIDGPATPLFPLGHGLSYTTWAYSDLAVRVGTTTDDIVVDVTVTNTGKRAGDEVVQVYACDEVASIGVPQRRLVAFRRIAAEPGVSTRVHCTIPAGRLGFHGRDMRFRVEPGDVTFFSTGLSCRTTIAGSVDLPNPNTIGAFRVEVVH
jgi:beta-glucosidase